LIRGAGAQSGTLDIRGRPPERIGFTPRLLPLDLHDGGRDEAPKIRRELAQKNPDTYLPDVARTLTNLGLLDRDQNRMGSIWITCCSGRLRILKTSCSISKPTSTTFARIPHEKGERRLRRCHDQSQISARFDGSPTADPCIRPQWLPDSLEDSGSLRHPVNL
jgi:hypothetical protein